MYRSHRPLTKGSLHNWLPACDLVPHGKRSQLPVRLVPPCFILQAQSTETKVVLQLSGELAGERARSSPGICTSETAVVVVMMGRTKDFVV